MKNYGGALVVAGALALAGCSNSSGPDGANGSNGTNGTSGTNGANGVSGSKLSLAINSVKTANGTSTLTFTVSPAAAVCPGGTCDATLSKAVAGNTSFSAQMYNPATNTFDTANNFTFTGVQFQGISADGNGAVYAATKKNPPFAPETSTSAYVYAYVTGLSVIPSPGGNYYLASSVASAAKVFGALNTSAGTTWASAANVAGCEGCHGKPYAKHGYREAAVAGLPDFASCKVCHTDQRVGSDGEWFVLADDPATLAQDPNVWNTTLYGYTANLMNDVHNSHSMKFDYPQSMSNCVTCHANGGVNKLSQVINDTNFKASVCKSCHPVQAKAGVETGRAPSFATMFTGISHPVPVAALYTIPDDACGVCHVTGNLMGAPTFASLHAGYNPQIYSDANGTRYDASRIASVVGATYDSPSYVGTVTFSMAGLPSGAVVTPTIVGSLYGWGSKDFVVSGHNSPTIQCNSAAGCTTGAMIVTPNANNTWTATFNLSGWSNLISSGEVQRMEIGFLPSVGIDPTTAVTGTNYRVAGSNVASGVTGVTETIDLTQTSANAVIPAANVYGKNIVDKAKCNACHDELGTSFHSPYNGSAGTVGCRLCHTVNNAASNFEMQSRSIDSYVHAFHAMQANGDKSQDLTNPVTALQYSTYVGGFFPNFAGPMNCEACHTPGTYEVPNQQKSLPGLISGSYSMKGRTGMGSFGQEIAGPAARACGACHRAFFINANGGQGDGSSLAALVGHFNGMGSDVTDPTLSASMVAAYIEGQVGGAPATTLTVSTGSMPVVERCEECHPTAGSDHQNLFNSWRNGL